MTDEEKTAMSTHTLAGALRPATAEEICDLYGMTGQEFANAINEPITLPVDCPHCDGAGWIEGEIYGVCRTTGAPLSNSYRCSTCKGTGRVEEEILPRTEYDLDDEDALGRIETL